MTDPIRWWFRGDHPGLKWHRERPFAERGKRSRAKCGEWGDFVDIVYRHTTPPKAQRCQRLGCK
jgi:hypothetical protein